MFYESIKNSPCSYLFSEVGSMSPTYQYQVFLQEKAQIVALLMSSVSRDSRVFHLHHSLPDDCLQLHSSCLVMNNCSDHVCLAHYLPKAWLERLAFFHLSVLQETPVSIIPLSPQSPGAGSAFPSLSLFLLSCRRQSLGKWCSFFPRASRKLLEKNCYG